MFYIIKSNEYKFREDKDNSTDVRAIDSISSINVLFGYACEKGSCYYDEVYDNSGDNGIRKYSLDKSLNKQIIEKLVNEKKSLLEIV